ncbi:MAG: energy transducer TonB [Pseudomonadota bacterium]
MFKRLLSSTPFGLAVTLGLLLCMHRLLALDLPTVPPHPNDPVPVWLAKMDIVEAVVIDELWEPPAPLNPPPGPPPSDSLSANLGPIGLAQQGLRKQPLPTLLDDLAAPPDGPLVRLLTVAPNYPASAIGRDLEGSVTVRFDVTAQGDVINASVVTSTHGVFEASALKAVGKFRFKPRVVDGIALPSQGVTYRFQYRMDD